MVSPGSGEEEVPDPEQRRSAMPPGSGGWSFKRASARFAAVSVPGIVIT
jgi:hypothetical protein